MPGIKRASETPINHDQAVKKRKDTQSVPKSPLDVTRPGKENGHAKQDYRKSDYKKPDYKKPDYKKPDYKKTDYKKSDYKKLEEKQKIAMSMNSSAGSKCRIFK